MHKSSLPLIFIVMLVLIFGVSIVSLLGTSSPADIGFFRRDPKPEEQKTMDLGGQHHGPLSVIASFPAIQKPDFRKAVEGSDLAKRVIGILIDGVPLAFPIEAMSDRRTHLVGLSQGNSDYLVSYCNLSECARVLTQSDGRVNPVEVRLGGLQKNGEMVLMVDGERYVQDSEDLPLEDVDFEMTSLNEWQQKHPETLVYEGEAE